MPIDPTEPATTTGTDRRAFLTRSAAGGALVATVATTGLAGLGLGAAAAQEGATAPPTVAQEFAAVAAPLELAASVAYEAALANEGLSEELMSNLRQFQRNHQDVAAALTEAMHPDAAAPRADAAVAAQFSPPPGSDEKGVVDLLAALEESLSATHLGAIGTFDDSSFAKIVSQVLAIEAQQAVVLGRAGGASIESLTPATATTEGALQPGSPATAPDTDSDTEADTEAGAQEGADEGTATDSGNEADGSGADTGTEAPDAADGTTESEGGTDAGAGSDANSADDSAN